MKYRLTLSNAKCPVKNNPTDAAYDLFTPEYFILLPEEIRTIDVGFQCELPKNYYAQILGRSKLAKKGIIILGGVIDNKWKDNWGIVMSNIGQNAIIFEIGDAIAQFVINNIYPLNMDFELVDSFDLSDKRETGIWTN